jgi:hypothetical protein
MTRLIVVARNDQFPSLNHSLPPRGPSLQTRGNLASPSGGAPLFDATDDRWIVPPSTMSVDAGAAADLRHTQAAHKRPSSCPLPDDDGRPLHPVLEALTVALGLTLFGLIAGVFLLLA